METRDPSMFTIATLAGFDGVMFVLNSDESVSASVRAGSPNPLSHS